MDAVLTIISIIAIFSSPIVAVLVGQHLQNRKKDHDAKMHLFLTLLSRRASQVDRDFVNALNLIDVIFHDRKSVLDAWHKHFENLHKKDEVNLSETRQRSFLDLVQAISTSLGYKQLKQTDVDKVYSPVAHEDQAIFDQALKTNLVGFLESGKTVFEYIKNEADKKKDASPIPPKPEDYLE